MAVRRSGFSLLAVGAVAAFALTGCGSSTDGNTASPTPAPTSAPATTPAPSSQGGGPAISDQAADKLCSDLSRQLSDWRVQGPTLGKPGLNILVQTWAAQNGVINADVVRDRSIIDKVTSQKCADTRQQAIEALNIPDLASGLLGF